MADKKISQLTGASTPLAGSEVLPVVQGGATVKVSVDNLTAGKAVSGASFSPTGATVPANGMYLRAANVLGLSTNNAQAIDIDASGNVGVNITNQVDHGKFVVSNIGGNTNGAITLLSNDQSTARLRLFNFGSGGRNLSFVAGDPGADNTGLTLYDNANTRNVLRVDNSDNFTVSLGNFVIGTAGKGIAFANNTITEDKVSAYKKSASTTIATSAGRSDLYFNVLAGQTFTTTAAGFGGLVTITTGDGVAATFFWSWNSATITILATGSALFAATSTPSATEIGIFKSASSNTFSVKNGTASTKAITICLVGDYAASTTDPA